MLTIEREFEFEELNLFDLEGCRLLNGPVTNFTGDSSSWLKTST